MNKLNYGASHNVVRVMTKRIEASPFEHRYATDEMVCGIYCDRFFAMSVGDDPIEQYWKLRGGVMLFDVPEKPLEVIGPDAVALLERLLSRRVDTLKTWRARYALACTPSGGILMDGVLMRLADDHFWFVQANGPFEPWLLAYADGLDVEIHDPKSRVLQIQGPRSLDVLKAASKTDVPDSFGYFHAGRFDFAGQQLLVSRTGWTGEVGIEIYCEGATTDHDALWDHLFEAGKSFGMEFSAQEAMGIRRLEAGILDNGTDIDTTMTPFEAGLGQFVDLEKPEFVGKDALLAAKRRQLLFGLSCDDATPFAGLEVLAGDSVVGNMTAGAWTPYLQKGIGFVRFKSDANWDGPLYLRASDGDLYDCTVSPLPFYDKAKRIARGLEFLSDSTEAAQASSP
ncbi:MAG: aminomethyl transferase family protein [Chromatiales bacterium]|nr:aminomethyl transferase family protein [Chromatiales bacterium]